MKEKLILIIVVDKKWWQQFKKTKYIYKKSIEKQKGQLHKINLFRKYINKIKNDLSG